MDDRTQKLNNPVSGMDNYVQDMSGKYRCMGCMEFLNENEGICPYCGYVKNTGVEQPLYIIPGTILKNKYLLVKVLGYGGFGVTYIGWNLTLQRKIAVKEYLPSEFSTRGYGQTKVTVFSGDIAQQFEDGKRKIIDEAKRLAKFQGEKGIVNIFDSFEENGTAYIVMEYLDGVTLKEYLSENSKIPAQKAVELLVPVLESLNKIHAVGIIHRDVSPDNIMITKDGRVKLIDFGVARYATTTASRSLTVIIKEGYSPEEQYRSRSDQGPYTDVYSFGAVLYKMITGETPPDALKRRAYYESKGKDILVPIHKLVKDVPKNIEYAIYNAMNPRIEDRTPDMVNFMGELFSDEPIKRKNGKIKKVDVLILPIWAKILVPSLISIALILSILLGVGVIGPRSKLQLGVKIPEGMTLIPDVVTETLDKAKEMLENLGLKVKVVEEENKEVAAGTVFKQSIRKGEEVKARTTVTITVSKSSESEKKPSANGEKPDTSKPSEKNLISSGKCGPNVTYELDSKGTLTISGSGPMTDYEHPEAMYVTTPWYKNDNTKKVQEIVINDAVTSIGNAAFAECSNTKKAYIPNSVTKIGKDAFYNLAYIEDIKLPNSIKTIGSSAFYDCKSLKKIIMPPSVTIISPYIFPNCENLREITLPKSVKEIGEGAFWGKNHKYDNS